MMAALIQSTDSSHCFRQRVSKVWAAKVQALWAGIRQKCPEALRGKVAGMGQAPAEQTLVLGAASRMLWADCSLQGAQSCKGRTWFLPAEFCYFQENMIIFF